MRQIAPDDACPPPPPSSATHTVETQHPPGIYPVPNSTQSYWRSHPHPIDAHRSTLDLPPECDIAILGAGMSGVALAYHLLKDYRMGEQPRILLLDAREVCSGATGRNGGHVKCKTDTLLNVLARDGAQTAAALAELVHAQISALEQIVRVEGLDCEFEVRRSWDVFFDAADAEAKHAAFARACEDSVNEVWTREVRWVGGEAVERQTGVRRANGAFSSPACSFWPYKFVSRLLAKMVARGEVGLQTRTPVHRISRCGETGASVLHTPRGTVNACKVLLATNGYTAGVCPAFEDVITPVKGTAAHLVSAASSLSDRLKLQNTYNLTYTPGRTDYLNPRPDTGVVMGGASWTFAHDRTSWHNNWDDGTLFPFPATRAHFERLMGRHFVDWEGAEDGVERIWTGIMGATGDGWPHVGRVPGPEGDGRWMMAGFNGGGMAMIWLTAKGLAKMVVEGCEFAETGLPAVFETSEGRMPR